MSNLDELTKLIKDVILPQMIQLQIEVDLLRKYTWPYVQAQKEQNQLDDMDDKKEFTQVLDDDTIKELLNLKSKFSKSSGFQIREYDVLKNHFC